MPLLLDNLRMESLSLFPSLSFAGVHNPSIVAPTNKPKNSTHSCGLFHSLSALFTAVVKNYIYALFFIHSLSVFIHEFLILIHLSFSSWSLRILQNFPPFFWASDVSTLVSCSVLYFFLFFLHPLSYCRHSFGRLTYSSFSLFHHHFTSIQIIHFSFLSLSLPRSLVMSQFTNTHFRPIFSHFFFFFLPNYFAIVNNVSCRYWMESCFKS